MASLLTPGALRLTPGTSTPLAVTGSDDNGATAPILAGDIQTSYDPSLLVVTPKSDGTLSIRVKPVPEGEITPLTLTVAGISTTIAVHIGFATVPLVNPAKSGAVHVSGAGASVVAIRRGSFGLRVSPTKPLATVTAAASVAFPAGTAKLSVTAIGDGGKHSITAIYRDARGHKHSLALGTLTGQTAQRLEAAAPAAGRLIGLQIGATSKTNGGFVILTGIAARA